MPKVLYYISSDYFIVSRGRSNQLIDLKTQNSEQEQKKGGSSSNNNINKDES